MPRISLALSPFVLVLLVGCVGAGQQTETPFHPATPIAMSTKPGEIAWVSQGMKIYACTADSSGVRCVPATIQKETR